MIPGVWVFGSKHTNQLTAKANAALGRIVREGGQSTQYRTETVQENGYLWFVAHIQYLAPKVLDWGDQGDIPVA